MYYSYVMGVNDSIKKLIEQGFTIENDGENFMVSFPKDRASDWENYISKHLKTGYWNEYLDGNIVVFLFHLQDGIKRFEVFDYSDDDVLKLCEKLCDRKFDSLKIMLSDNHFYKNKIGE